SPLSFRSTRRYFRSLCFDTVIPLLAGVGEAVRPASPAPSLTQCVAREAPHDDVLARLRRHLGDQLPDRLVRITDVGLLEERVLLVELLELALDDLVPEILGLALVLDLLLEDRTLTLDHILGDPVLRYRERVRRGDVHGDVLDEFLEILGPGDEIGLA